MKLTDSHQLQKRRSKAHFRGGGGEMALSCPKRDAAILQEVCMRCKGGWVKAGDLAGRILAIRGFEDRNPAFAEGFSPLPNAKYSI